ncbi:hypothetical protein BDV95DRAFT_359758 [Massariosphaeria phaeospora]|uniref:Uncharacterized protein n=1 Tax=Massariosphaeria phaeospora TaxID=100035 RepID=A0A7C8I7X0_9PLEO|nr:hypothetical protein BDV95DRAFT_359758 [Massariosphaeria phaeospora]
MATLQLQSCQHRLLFHIGNTSYYIHHYDHVSTAATSNSTRIMPSNNPRIEEVLANTSDEAQQIDEIAKIRRWFGPDDNSPTYPIIQQYLSDDLDLATTTARLLDPIDAKLSAGHARSANWLELWYSILHSAKRIPFRTSPGSTAKLVSLMRAIQQHQDPRNAPGESGAYTTLKDFSLASREAQNDTPQPFGTPYAAEVHAWANLHFFWAALTRAGVLGFQTSAYWVIWMMRSALETVPRDDAESSAAQKCDGDVPAAAAWVFGAGRAVYENERDLTPTRPMQGNPARGGELWTGRAEMSKGRWALWKRRFGEVAEMEGVSEETRDIAREAVGKMEEAERG